MLKAGFWELQLYLLEEGIVQEEGQPVLQTLYSLSWTEETALFLLRLFNWILILIKSLKIQRRRANSPASLRENAREGFTLPEICQFDFILIMAPAASQLLDPCRSLLCPVFTTGQDPVLHQSGEKQSAFHRNLTDK